MPLQKAVAVCHASVFTAPFLCFCSFSAAPSQLKSSASMKNHFPGLYCGNSHSLLPSKTTFPRQSCPGRHLQREEQREWYDVCKSRAAHGNTMKKISKTKDRRTASFASYCLKKVDNKRQRAITQKNISGKMKRNGARDKRMGAWKPWNSLRWTKRVGAWRPGTSARNKRKSIGSKENSGAKKKQNKKDKAAGEGLELVRETKGSQSEARKTPAQKKTKQKRQSRWRRPGTSARNKRKSIGSKENSGAKKNKTKQKRQSRWRRPGTSARNKRKSIARHRKPQRKTKQSRCRTPGTSTRSEWSCR